MNTQETKHKTADASQNRDIAPKEAVDALQKKLNTEEFTVYTSLSDGRTWVDADEHTYAWNGVAFDQVD